MTWWWWMLSTAAAQAPAQDAEPAPVELRPDRRQFRELRRCYEQGRRLSPGLQGRLAVIVTVQGGRVLSVEETGAFPSATVVACFQDRIQGWTVDSTAEGVANLTFVLDSPRALPGGPRRRR